VKFAKEKSMAIQKKGERKRSIGKTITVEEPKERKINCED